MPRIILCVSIFLSFNLNFAFAGGRFIDDGQEIFFPKELGGKLAAYKDFPVTWWNFLVWDLGKTPDSETWEKMGELCKALKNQKADLIKSLECRQDVIQYKEIIQDWVQDLPLRHPFPGEEQFGKVLKRALTKASLPMGSEILSLIRQDPFESYEELIRLSSDKAGIQIDRTEGFFYDPAFKRVVVPVQFKFPPERDALTKEFTLAFLNLCKERDLCGRWALLGPHGSTLENKAQIMNDVSNVSVAGLITMGGFSIFLILIKRARLLLLTPPVLLSFALTTLLTIVFFSTIHGLTMAFGIGNIGLSQDYGVHCAFNRGKKSVWKSNTVCFFTTAIVLFVLCFSKTPLITQLMFFSLCGITIAFIIFWAMFRWFPHRFEVAPFPIHPDPSKAKALLVAAVCIGGICIALGLSPNMNLSAMDYQSENQKMFRKWIYDKLDKKNLLFEVTKSLPKEESAGWSQERFTWARNHSIKAENAALYLPDPEVQRQNLSTWKKFFCSKPEGISPPGSLERTFFFPFFEIYNCQSLTKRTPVSGRNRGYASGFFSQDKEISFWFPIDEMQRQQIVQNYPQADSLKELSNVFTHILIKELKWMTPLSLFAILALLFFYFRRSFLTFVTLIPFFTAVGLYFCSIPIFKSEFSFVSVIGLLIVCGISVDYGVFATDVLRRREEEQGGVWSGILLAAITTIATFVPLVFSRHPVLIQLGQTVSLGIVGAVLGAFWGIPYFMKTFRKNSSEV